MKRMRMWLRCGAAITGLWLVAPAAWAVVVAGPTSDYSTYNTSPTSLFPSFNYVGTVNGSSGVYLGNGYAITASHVGAGSLTLTNANGTTTTYLQDTSYGVTRLSTADTPSTDLFVFKLQSAPVGLAPLTISSSPVNSSTPFYLAGNGLDRVDTTPENPAGYALAGTQKLRFGTATAVSNGVFTTTDSNGNAFGTQHGFITEFTSDSGSAQAVSHDSGGGVFSTTVSTGINPQNTLQGIMLAMSTVTNQPGNTAYYGDGTYIADLSYYRTQINSIVGVPEPTLLGVVGLAGVTLLRRRRRSR